MMMMISIKALLVAQWIGLLSAGKTVNSHALALVLQAHLSLPKIVTLRMNRHGEQALIVRWNGLVDHITLARGAH